MLILRMATRNLFRQWGRNALSMVSIVLGVFIIIAGRGFQGGLIENMVRGQIDSASGHVLVVGEDYPTSGFRYPVDEAWTLSDPMRDWLEQSTVHWTPRLIATPRAIKGREAMRIRLVGIGPEDGQVFPQEEWSIEGERPQAGAEEILIASGPARLLDAKPGDLITLESRTVDGALNALRFTVSGILSTGNPMVDNLGMFTSLETADRLLNAKGRLTHVAVRLESREDTADWAARAEAELQGLDARTWQEESAALMDSQKMRQTMFDVMGLAMMLMAATGIANTVLMAAFERVREIGTLRSMGLQRSGVQLMFALEGFWMGLIGGSLGALAGGALCKHFHENGIDMAALMGGKTDAMGEVPMASTLYLSYSQSTMAAGVVIAVLVAVTASLYPAWSASKVSPAQAVRAS